MLRFLPFCSLIFACIFPYSVQAYCIESWACVSENRHSEGVEFWVSNKKAYAITVTIDVDTRNLKSEASTASNHQRTLVLEGFQEKPILKLQEINPDRRFWYSDSFYWNPVNMNSVHDQTHYELPYSRDEKYRIVQGFGGGFSHRGASKYAVDIAMPVGTPVHAARGGVVIDLVERHNRGGASRRYSRYANFITIQHSDGTTGEYYHLKKNGAAVDVGDRIKVGQLIGYSGNTGFSSLPHLHFAIYRAKSHGNYESLPFRFNKR